MNQPVVSVILTAYNAENYIRNAIKSVLEQTYTDFELLIYNDGSSDGTAEAVKSFSDPRIRFFSSDINRHIAYGTNLLLRECTGSYIAVIDADDIWMPEKLEKQIRFLSENEGFDGCFSWADIIDENGEICNQEHPDFYELFRSETNTREYWLRYFFFNGNRLCNPSAVFTASSAAAIGPHNLFYIQATDFEWWVRFAKKYRFAVLPEPLIRYRGNFKDENKTSSKNEQTLTRYVNELACIRMHFFEDLDDDLFVSAFRDFFVNPEAGSPEELECEKLFLSLIPFKHAKSVPASGLLLLEKAMADERFAEVLFEKYGFSTGKIGEYSGKHVFNDLFTENLSNENSYLKSIRNNDQTRMTYYREAARLAEVKQAEAVRKLSLLEQQLEAVQTESQLQRDLNRNRS